MKKFFAWLAVCFSIYIISVIVEIKTGFSFTTTVGKPFDESVVIVLERTLRAVEAVLFFRMTGLIEFVDENRRSEETPFG